MSSFSSPALKDVSLYQFFSPGGVLSRTHPAYEFRRGQLQMAQAVEQALTEKRHLIVEAGTGTGKTLAYLVPVIRSGKRVIISTGTKNLQEQLFYKDIPFLEQALFPHGEGKLSVCYMKGRANYLCRKKLYDLTDQPVLSAEPAADLMADSIRRERFLLTLMSLFSAVSLALASAGIFGVLAYAVAQRSNEIGVRMALGASPAQVLTLVVGQGMRLVALGVGGGLAAAFAFSKVLAGLLYDVDPRDPAVFVAMPILVFAIALLASWIPAARALHVDPASALRVE